MPLARRALSEPCLAHLVTRHRLGNRRHAPMNDVQVPHPQQTGRLGPDVEQEPLIELLPDEPLQGDLGAHLRLGEQKSEPSAKIRLRTVIARHKTRENQVPSLSDICTQAIVLDTSTHRHHAAVEFDTVWQQTSLDCHHHDHLT